VETYNGLRNERYSSGFQTLYASCVEGKYTLQAGGVSGSSFDSIDRIHQILLNELANGVRNSPIDLGNSLGEYRETAKLVSSAMVKSARLYRAVRKFNFSEALRVVTGRRNDRYSDTARAAADAWLGFTYGVRPIMNDVYGAMEALGSGQPEIPLHVVRASHKVQFHSKAKYVYYEGETLGAMKGTAKYVFLVDNPLLFTLDQVGVVNPVALTWELIPFSFVVDWFLPIGDFLRGVVPPPGIKSLYGYTYVKGSGVAKQSTDIPGYPGWKTKASSRELFKDRRVFSGFPDYQLLVPDLSLSKTQLASGMALLTSFFLNR
jgi:hypothetical protein